MKRSLAVRFPWRVWALGVVVLVGSVLSSPAYTLVVAPARYSVLQVAFDVLARTPAVLVSYQGEGTAAEPVLHAWNGSEWVLLTLKDYREGNFLQKVPERVVLIGDDATLPASVLESSAWVSDVIRVRDLTTGSLVNEFGHILKWRSTEWNWFAKRYNLTLTDESEARRKSSWYDRQGPLPGRPRVIERITEGPAPEPAVVPVVEPEAVTPVDVAPVDVVPAVDPAPAEPSANSASIDTALDQQTDEALKSFN